MGLDPSAISDANSLVLIFFCLLYFFLVCFQYYGTWSSEKVKSRVIEVIFSWTVWFPEDVKIRDAYQMLKKQGLVLLFQFPFQPSQSHARRPQISVLLTG